jgi:1-acyl-sn-glycerol-3-phosphate acyltransferase
MGLFYKFCKTSVAILAKGLFQAEILNEANIPKKGAFILASNHCSYLDPPIIGALIDREMCYMGKKELFSNRFFAMILKKLNIIPTNRTGVDRTALKNVLKFLKRGIGLLLFPEGTRSLDGTLGPGRNGIAFLAINTGVVVIPVFIKGTREALPRGSSFIKLAKVRVIFGQKLFPPKAIHGTAKQAVYKDFTNRIMQEIANLEKKIA